MKHVRRQMVHASETAKSWYFSSTVTILGVYTTFSYCYIFILYVVEILDDVRQVFKMTYQKNSKRESRNLLMSSETLNYFMAS